MYDHNKPLNILFLYHMPVIPYMGGVEKVTFVLTRELRKKGHNVFFFYTNSGTTKQNPDFMSPYTIWDRNNKTFSSALNDYIKENHVDIIINQSFTYDTLNLFKNSNSIEAKIISVLHMQPFTSFGRERLFKKLYHPDSIKGHIIRYIALIYPGLYRRKRVAHDGNLIKGFTEVSAKVYLLSNEFIPRIKNIFPNINSSKLDAVNNPNTFSNTEIHIQKKENLIIFVARLVDPQKNVTAFIDVWNIFHKSHPDWSAKIIGDGPQKDYFEKYALKKHTQNLEFTGNLKDVAYFYEKAKFLCMTSIYEGWGMVLTEAMSYGCLPVAFKSYEAITEIIQNKTNGILVQPFDKNQMAHELNILADNEHLRIKMATEAIESVQKFNPDLIANIWIDKITKLING